MAAPFLRRVQTRPVNPLFGVPLIEVAQALIVGSCAGGAAHGTIFLYEIDFWGVSFIPWLCGSMVFVRLLKHYRLRGDGVVRKDGIFRAQQSHKINQVLCPDYVIAESKFVVVTTTIKQKDPFFRRMVDGFIYGLGLRQRPEVSYRVPGDKYCHQVALRYRAMKQRQREA